MSLTINTSDFFSSESTERTLAFGNENSIEAGDLIDFLLSTGFLDIDLPITAALHCMYDFSSFIGEGSTYQVERWSRKGVGLDGHVPTKLEAVAVKRVKHDIAVYKGELDNNRRIGSEQQRNIAKVLLETRIMSQSTLRDETNILKLLGFGWEPLINGGCAIHLVVELAELGQMDDFLALKTPDPSQKQMLCVQVAHGLEALHRAGIVHGDLKLENLLVFREGDGYVAKLADFGQSLMETPTGLSGKYTGTSLLLPPEIRHDISSKDQVSARLDFESGKCCDVFCYGFIVWEVFKDGRRYFEKAWFPPNSDLSNDELLNTLPHNGLLEKSLHFVSSLSNVPSDISTSLHNVFKVTLDDCPTARSLIREVCNIWKTTDSQKRSSVAPAKSRIVGSQNTSLGQIVHHMTLTVLAESGAEANLTSAGIAAFELSFCHLIGFGVEESREKMLDWLHRAEKLGSVRAFSLSRKLHHALSVPYKKIDWNRMTEEARGVIAIEDELARVPESEYFPTRIRLYQALNLQMQRSASFLIYNVETRKSHSFRLNELDTVKKILESERDHVELLRVMSQDNRYLKPPVSLSNVHLLHFFALHGENEIMQVLLRHGAKINQLSQNLTPITAACIGGQFTTVKLLLEAGADASVCEWHETMHSSFRKSPIDFCYFAPLNWLIMFAKVEAEEIIVPLLCAGANLYAWHHEILFDEHFIKLGGSPMHFAVTTANINLVKLLLKHGANGHGLADSGFRTWRPLGEALSLNQVEIAKTILAQPDARERLRGFNFATFMLFQNPVLRWLQHGTRASDALRDTIRLSTDNGFIDLDEEWESVCEIGESGHNKFSYEVFEIMLREGIDLSSKEDSLPFITTGAHPDFPSPLIKLFLEHGADVNASSYHGRTPLHCAANRNNFWAVETFLQHGANINAIDHDGRTALHLASATHHTTHDASTEVIRILLANGIDSKLKDAKGLSALERAIIEANPANEDCIELLLSSGRQNSIINEETGDTCLHIAVRQPESENACFVLNTLLGFEIVRKDINLFNKNGHSALHDAACDLETVYVGALLEAGASASEPLPGQLSLLEVSLFAGRAATTREQRYCGYDIATMLLGQDEQSAMPSFSGITYLHLALYLGLREKYESLIAHGVDEFSGGRLFGATQEETAQQLLQRCTSTDFDVSSLVKSLPRQKKEKKTTLGSEYSSVQTIDDPTFGGFPLRPSWASVDTTSTPQLEVAETKRYYFD